MFYWYRRTQVKAWVRNLIREQLVISWGTTMVLSHSLTFPIVLRYYATFKVRKYVSLFHKINTCLQKITTCTGLKTEQIFSVNIWYTYFSILGVAFAVPFLCYFQKFQLLVVKNFELIFAALYFYIYELKKRVPDF